MASAVLPSRNDQKWGNTKGLMKNYPPNRSNFPNFTQNPSFNSQNPHLLQNPIIHPNFHNVNNDFHNREFISFDLASLSKAKLNQLKNRLVTELRCVRAILNRIERHEFGGKEQKQKQKRKREVERGGGGREGGKRRGGGREGNSSSPVSKAMKKCREVLLKLMNLKSSVPFNQPVDVEVLQLPDYNAIIREPMDLGTIKGKLAKGRYRTPGEFAADVRLTFGNAMVYNPKGSKVYVSAEKLLLRFEQLFDPIWRIYEPVAKGLNHKEPKENVESEVVGKRESVVSKLGGLRKREMRIEEKEELVEELQQMPPEVAARMVHVLRGLNPSLMLEGDEIELDIEALDVETLWEIQGFVAKYKKVSKMREQEQVTVLDLEKDSPVMVLGPDNVEMNKKAGEVEEDVDIGEEILEGYFPSVEIEKDVAAPNNSGSIASSSSSDTDSSSSSDSDSSSLSRSEEDGVRSPFVEPAKEARRMDEV